MAETPTSADQIPENPVGARIARITPRAVHTVPIAKKRGAVAATTSEIVELAEIANLLKTTPAFHRFMAIALESLEKLKLTQTDQEYPSGFNTQLRSLVTTTADYCERSFNVNPNPIITPLLTLIEFISNQKNLTLIDLSDDTIINSLGRIHRTINVNPEINDLIIDNLSRGTEHDTTPRTTLPSNFESSEEDAPTLQLLREEDIIETSETESPTKPNVDLNTLNRKLKAELRELIDEIMAKTDRV